LEESAARIASYASQFWALALSGGLGWDCIAGGRGVEIWGVEMVMGSGG
jgi:hypothetical protein